MTRWGKATTFLGVRITAPSWIRPWLEALSSLMQGWRSRWRKQTDHDADTLREAGEDDRDDPAQDRVGGAVMGFIGRGEDDGRPGRQYRGKPQPLGSLTEWKCPSCGGTVSQAFEMGCNLCGAGQPDTRPVQEPQPRQLTEDSPGLQSHAPRVGATPTTVSAGKPGNLRPEGVGAALVVTRIIQYVCKPGQEAAMEQTLQRALVGRVGFAWGEITAAIVDDVSTRQQDILSLAKRQPGVWLGGPDKETRYPLMRMDVSRTGGAAAGDRVLQQVMQHMVPPMIGGMGGAGMTLPDQGPEYSRMDDEMARVLVQACGVKVAYSLALALQTFAAANDNSDPLVIDQQACYALANAIMHYIPKEYVEPELPPPPPPNDPAAQAVSEEVRARIAAIQAASKPTASFRE